MVKGKTATGFNFKITDDARDDMELLENITRFDRGERDLLPMLIEGLLGTEQKKRLYEHCRSKAGRVSAKAVLNEVAEILNIIQNSGDTEVKN